MKIRTFYYRIDRDDCMFKLLRIDGPLPQSPKVGDRHSVQSLTIIASNGNKVVILPNRKNYIVTYTEGRCF